MSHNENEPDPTRDLDFDRQDQPSGPTKRTGPFLKVRCARYEVPFDWPMGLSEAEGLCARTRTSVVGQKHENGKNAAVQDKS
jgi:hypothetical protein